MTADRLTAFLPTFSSNEEARVDVNDWAVNTLRDWARDPAGHGFGLFSWRAETENMLREEFARIDAGKLDVVGYLRAHRGGSKYLLNRQVRLAVFALKATRDGWSPP